MKPGAYSRGSLPSVACSDPMVMMAPLLQLRPTLHLRLRQLLLLPLRR